MSFFPVIFLEAVILNSRVLPLTVAYPMRSPLAEPTLTSNLVELVAPAFTINSEIPSENTTFFATAYPPAPMLTPCLLGVSLALLRSVDASPSTVL